MTVADGRYRGKKVHVDLRELPFATGRQRPDPDSAVVDRRRLDCLGPQAAQAGHVKRSGRRHARVHDLSRNPEPACRDRSDRAVDRCNPRFEPAQRRQRTDRRDSFRWRDLDGRQAPAGRGSNRFRQRRVRQSRRHAVVPAPAARENHPGSFRSDFTSASARTIFHSRARGCNPYSRA